MNQFLNNLFVGLNSINPIVLNIIYILFTIIENYLSMKIFLTLFNVQASKKQTLLYLISTLVISIISANFIGAPFNVIFSLN